MKSDDTVGRVKAYESIVKGENLPAAEVPESFKVLVKEMKSLCLNVELEGNGETVSLNDGEDEQEEAADMLASMAADAAKTANEEGEDLSDIAAALSDLIGEDLKEMNEENELIGGEEE